MTRQPDPLTRLHEELRDAVLLRQREVTIPVADLQALVEEVNHRRAFVARLSTEAP